MNFVGFYLDNCRAYEFGLHDHKEIDLFCFSSNLLLSNCISRQSSNRQADVWFRAEHLNCRFTAKPHQVRLPFFYEVCHFRGSDNLLRLKDISFIQRRLISKVCFTRSTPFECVSGLYNGLCVPTNHQPCAFIFTDNLALIYWLREDEGHGLCRMWGQTRD